MSYYFHNVPGRLRVRSPRIKGNRRAAARLRRLLTGLAGVTAVAVNQVTGSVVIRYERGRTWHTDLLRLLTEHGYFDAARAVTHDEYVRAAVSRAGHALTRLLFEQAVERTLGPLPLAVLAGFALPDGRPALR